MEYARQEQSLPTRYPPTGNGSGGMLGVNAQGTLASRLERAAYTLISQCDRIEDTLAKVNGTPRNTSNKNPENVAATAPLAQSVEQVEQLAKRLCDLASNLESIA